MSFGSLYIGVTGLLNQRTSLNTVSHNMANTENPNYVRQSALHANQYYRDNGRPNLQVGTGSKISQIRQIRDGFLDIRFRAETAKFGFHQAKDEVLEEVENIFVIQKGRDKVGLPEVMNTFWHNISELSKHPEALTNRSLVYQQGVAVSDTLNRMAKQLDDLRRNLNKEIYNNIERCNSILDRISTINQNIRTYEGASPKIEGTDANGVKFSMNDLRDERNALVDELSKIIPITVHQNYDGELVVHVHGKMMVGGGYVNHIIPKADEKGLFFPAFEDDQQHINLGQGAGLKSDKEAYGVLGGLLRVRDESIPKYHKQLDDFARALATEINKLHRNGYGLKDDITAPLVRRPFFLQQSGVDDDDKITAANIRMNSELANLNNIAASESGAVGDGKIFEKIMALRKKDDFIVDKNGKKYTVDTYFRNTVFEVGVERQSSRTVAEAQIKTMMAIDERRQEISGVSLDEEMADMLKYQHAYSANSRVINVVDEMMDQIVNRLGLVGR